MTSTTTSSTAIKEDEIATAAEPRMTEFTFDFIGNHPAELVTAMKYSENDISMALLKFLAYLNGYRGNNSLRTIVRHHASTSLDMMDNNNSSAEQKEYKVDAAISETDTGSSSSSSRRKRKRRYEV